MSKLSICMPSNRPLALAKKSIDYVLSLISGTDIEFVLSDNSGDADKAAYIRSLNCLQIQYINGPPVAFDNWQNAIKFASSAFVLMVSDDDIIVNLFGTPFESINQISPDVVGIRPGVVVFNPKAGLLKTTSFGIMGSTPKQRVEEYFNAAQGMNSTLFSAWRKDVILDLHDCFKSHPTRGGYTDWAFVLALVSSGRILEEKSTILFYNNANWYGDQEFIEREIAKLFLTSGLNAIDAKHLSLLQGVDSYILIRRHNSPESEQQKIEAANLVLVAYLKSYIKSGGGSQFTGLEKFLIDSLKKSKGHDEIFDSIYTILCYLGLGYKYQNFYKVSIGKDWPQL